MLIIPTVLIYMWEPVFVSGILVTLFVCTFWMKLISYVHTNHMLRSQYIQKKSDGEDEKEILCTYKPEQIGIKDIYYFLIIPTLCYQTNYPRTERIRIRYILEKVLVALLLSGVEYVIGGQYLHPLIEHSLEHIENANYLNISERVLKLSVPNLYLWLIGFYIIFDVYLNILAEITRFGDRKFYGDWWNAQTVGHYWRNWNLPVHNWMRRHVYNPCSKRFSTKTSLLICFFVSAFFHEYVLSVPFGQVKLWAFLGILAQVPLVVITEKFKDHHYTGNIMFWISIVLGQPFLILLYYRDFVKTRY
eukprot:TRINITY_DN4412_c0_g1_i1.p1 TRINITY_DN4412_c0_g1~~TRINITY_DN4412_c0_g1_i1.p1  ORF type:complete len:304 (-),score=21.72 TRINITY_DN4412_c0_g1_i1:25-936(-)